MGTSQEIEWQFAVADLELAGAAISEAAEAAGLRLSVPREIRLRDTFFDTRDWRFFSAFAYLRVRRRGRKSEATIKTFGTVDSGPRIRTEVTEELSRELHELEGPVGESVRAMVGQGQLCELFTHSTTRKVFRAFDGNCEVGEIALDHTVFEGADNDLRRIEVEAVGAQSEALLKFVASLSTMFSPCVRSKFAEGLAARRMLPSGPGQPEIDTGLDCTIGEFIGAAIKVYAYRIQESEPGVRLGLDSESVHNMRVGTRRLRTLLRLFRDVLPGRTKVVRDELAWLADMLGNVRDLDVQLDRLQELFGEEQVSGEDAAAIVSPLQEERAEARGSLLIALDSERFTELCDTMSELSYRISGKRAATSALSFLPGVLHRACAQALRDGSTIGPDSEADEYHRLRLRCKRLRYAADAARTLYGKPARAFCKTLADLQDLLGQHQDALVLIGSLRGVPERWGYAHRPTALDAIRRVESRLDETARQSRIRFPMLFSRVFNDAWPAFEERMLEAMAHDVVRETRDRWERERKRYAKEAEFPDPG